MKVDYDKLIQEIERIKEEKLLSWRQICKQLEKQVNKERKVKGLKPVEVNPNYIYAAKRR